LREQYAQISEEKDRLYQEYRKLQQKVKQHENVRANLEQLIRPEQKEKRRNRSRQEDRYK
jgi:small-conductance mechanosensitive channel